MKKYILPSIKLTALCLLLLSGVYTIILLGAGKLLPGKGKGELITQNGKTYYANIGQKFTDDKYFWSRPSAVDYNAAGSGGSNKGPNNEELLQTVQARIDTFLVHNPEINKSEIPVDLVTASGSGLDPNISVQAAKVQVKRVAKIRGLSEPALQQIISENTEGPFLGLFGPEKINVLKLNIALEELVKSEM
ncbi:MAG TPA: K(+)-transporting ATPase subunit C [Niabella sp.]|nr:K(+)-transporting ATPase subunit C [Niabella sp.]HOZ95860.1 K(+)-transporting ATPase subunit C [Niabella sp.]HQW13714.1 K(+)-transporting ATPase subunit C [Niabella sp.]HQX19109.1 K(+)-transporting ATPase subunit C [Niabella sp.]HQX41271.1 K(+)-transporting ATPase subunit C [Niabella sp.]